MSALLPSDPAPRIVVREGFPGAGALSSFDALLVLLPITATPDRRLPTATQWRAAATRAKPAHATAHATEFDTARRTVGVLGWCRANAEPFEVLRAAGIAAQKLLAERPRATRIALIAQVPKRQREVWQEALCAALLAQTFTLPTEKGTPPPARPALRLTLFGGSKLDLRRVLATSAATNLVRHLTALPPNRLDTVGYRRVLTTLARHHRLQLRWHDERALTRLGAGAFLAVSRGNPHRDAGIAHLRYRPRRADTKRHATAPIALVGKGVLFDTGGTNLKPHRSMLDMHIDMSGSAVALATLIALATLRAPFPADAWLAITENSIGPTAYRPQEVVRALNGTTIQVIHTDAEGRMVLADTLALAARSRPRLLLDFATLTGTCVYALTERYSGVFASSQALATQALTAGCNSGERLWPFPMPEDYDSDLDSATADVAQCAADSKGDHILAARFLQRFVPVDVPWLHIDLSSSTRRGGLAHVPTEITGFGARAALALLLDGSLPH
jgi:leucyl aminopeptidase